MLWIVLLCVCLCPPLLALILGVLGLFIPLGYVCYFFAFFAGLVTVLLTLGALMDFDITDVDDWKMLALGLLIPGGITGLLVLIGNWLGTQYTFEVLKRLMEFF